MAQHKIFADLPDKPEGSRIINNLGSGVFGPEKPITPPPIEVQLDTVTAVEEVEEIESEDDFNEYEELEENQNDSPSTDERGR
jgi:hypothetical protein